MRRVTHKTHASVYPRLERGYDAHLPDVHILGKLEEPPKARVVVGKEIEHRLVRYGGVPS